jgi:carbon storage regulator
MLILTRKPGETIIVGYNIKITVLSIKGNQIHISIEAPKDITIHREEIYELIKKGQNNDY